MHSGTAGNPSTSSIADRDATAVGVLGAAGLVGRPLVDLLAARGDDVVACSRSPGEPAAAARVTRCRPGDRIHVGGGVPRWVAVCPLWTVPEHLPWLESLGIRRLVAISSTSVITKRQSPAAGERAVAERLATAEADVTAWAAERAVGVCLLRPTMIYDGARDGNVAAIAAFVRRRGFFPLAGPARGLRQPVHAADVAAACIAALDRHPLPHPIYTLSGAEPLPFCDLVAEVFAGCRMKPRIIHVPRWLVSLAAAFTGAGGATSLAGMAARMNEDLAFEHAAAARDLGFSPRSFSACCVAAPAAAEPSASASDRLNEPPA